VVAVADLEEVVVEAVVASEETVEAVVSSWSCLSKYNNMY
jgi:hypothetical protein